MGFSLEAHLENLWVEPYDVWGLLQNHMRVGDGAGTAKGLCSVFGAGDGGFSEPSPRSGVSVVDQAGYWTPDTTMSLMG